MPELRALPAMIKQVWGDLSAVHKAVEHDSPDLLALARVVTSLRKAQE